MNRVFRILAVVGTVFLFGCASATMSGAKARDLQTNIPKLRLGMTPDDVISLVGRPAANNRTVTTEGTIYQWIHRTPRSRRSVKSEVIDAGSVILIVSCHRAHS